MHLNKHCQRSALCTDHVNLQVSTLKLEKHHKIYQIFSDSAWCAWTGIRMISYFNTTVRSLFFFPDEYAFAEYKTPCSPPSNWNQICARSNGIEDIRQTFVEEEDKRLGCFWWGQWKACRGIRNKQIPTFSLLKWLILAQALKNKKNNKKKLLDQCGSETLNNVGFLVGEDLCSHPPFWKYMP